MTVRLFLQVLAVGLATISGSPRPEQQSKLGPTIHPDLAAAAGDLWFVPPPDSRGGRAGEPVQALAAAVGHYESGDYQRALAALGRVKGEVARDYADYYRGLAHLRLEQVSKAREVLDALVDRNPAGALALSAALAQGEVAEARGDHRAAMAIYARLAADKQLVNEEVLARLGRAALAAGDRKRAAEAYVRVYYEFALTDAAVAAASHLQDLRDVIVRTGYKADLGRAAMLFGARRYADARSAFADVRREARGDDRELAELRIAECDFYLRRYQSARDALRPWLDKASRKAEARFFYLSAIRELGRHSEYVQLTRQLVSDFPDSSWSEEALNNLGTHYILTDEDEEAARAFTELYNRFPAGDRGERAAWKAGWWNYRQGNHAVTIRLFESAAATFPRSNYRPSFLYWAARSHAKLGASAEAQTRYQLVHQDYGNSYYGRLAGQHLKKRAAGGAGQAGVVPAAQRVPMAAAAPPPPTVDRIRVLLAGGLYDEALAELEHAQRQWGESPQLEATTAWAYHQKGELRRAITLMRRAYPQSLTAGGHALPVEIRQVIFPLVYWDLIRKHADARKLDPYVVAALINQESTFDPNARSVANAWGLMQILPSTGRRLARSVGIRSLPVRALTVPETNIRLGTLYFSRLSSQLGGAHFALASYNAGENRVIRWKRERPGLDTDEFIDDIPYPETQNYVKRILGTAEDYRMLYGRDGGKPQSK